MREFCLKKQSERQRKILEVGLWSPYAPACRHSHMDTHSKLFSRQSGDSADSYKVVDMVYGVLEALFWIRNDDPISETNFGQRHNCKILNKIYHIIIFMYI